MAECGTPFVAYSSLWHLSLRFIDTKTREVMQTCTSVVSWSFYGSFMRLSDFLVLIEHVWPATCSLELPSETHFIDHILTMLNGIVSISFVEFIFLKSSLFFLYHSLIRVLLRDLFASMLCRCCICSILWLCCEYIIVGSNMFCT